MRTIATFVALVVMTLSLAGCIQVAGEPEQKPSATASYNLSDEEYADLVRSEAPSLNDVPTGDLVENAQLVCESFELGASFDEIAFMFLDSGFTSNEAGTLIGGAVGWHCPEFLDEVTGSTI